ncbi:MAG: tetratricopeptide repeat protein, partial [Acidobacteriota bacterium]
APAVLLALGWPLYDRSDFRIADDFSRTLLDSLPPGAHLAASDDNILFVLIYLHLVEDLRPDINLIMQGVGGADLPTLRFDPDSDPLYFTHHPNWNHPQIDVVPVGLAFKTVRRGGELPEPVIPKTRLDGVDDPRVPKDYLASNLAGHFHYMLGITHEQRDWPAAEREMRRAAQIASRNDVLHYNLGLIYRRNGLVERALEFFERSHRINPRRLASDKPARASDRIAETREELDRKRRFESDLGTHPSLAGLGSGSAAWHLAIADLLNDQGEAVWARGHRLLASEIDAAAKPSGR